MSDFLEERMHGCFPEIRRGPRLRGEHTRATPVLHKRTPPAGPPAGKAAKEVARGWVPGRRILER